MCGVIAEFDADEKNTVNQIVVDAYEQQHSRGKEGFGIIRINKDKKVEIDRATEPVKFIMDLYHKPGNMIIAHHRNPTSTGNKLEQTHPILISNATLAYDYLFIHNGIISNDDDLKSMHEKLGFKYGTENKEEDDDHRMGYTYLRSTFNDSESIAIELALFIEGKAPHIGAQGSFSVIGVQIDKKTAKAVRVFFCRHTSPLRIDTRKGFLGLSSEVGKDEVEEDVLFDFAVDDKKFNLTEKVFTVLPYLIPKAEADKTFWNRHSGWSSKGRVISSSADIDARGYPTDGEGGEIRRVDITKKDKEEDPDRKEREEQIAIFEEAVYNEDPETISQYLGESLEDIRESIMVELEEFFNLAGNGVSHRDINVNDYVRGIKNSLIIAKLTAIAAEKEIAIYATGGKSKRDKPVISVTNKSLLAAPVDCDLGKGPTAAELMGEPEEHNHVNPNWMAG